VKVPHGCDIVKRTEVELFLRKKVRLHLKTNFGVNGTIEEVFDDCMRFKTAQAESLISLDQVASITELR